MKNLKDACILITLLLSMSCSKTRLEPAASDDIEPAQSTRMTNGFESDEPQDILLRSVITNNVPLFKQALTSGAAPDFVYESKEGQAITPILVATSHRAKEIFLELTKLRVNPFVVYDGVSLGTMVRASFGKGSVQELEFLKLEGKSNLEAADDEHYWVRLKDSADMEEPDFETVLAVLRHVNEDVTEILSRRKPYRSR